MYLPTLPNPIENALGGGDSLAVRWLHEFCFITQSNFNTIQVEFTALRGTLSELAETNHQLMKFMNWLAVTNPQVLDEFQATANAVEVLSPRDQQDFGESVASSAPM
jgi:hypothetical protein